MSAEPIKLLIVDDSAEDREIYARLLKKDGRASYKFISAETGREGLATLRTDAPQRIVLVQLVGAARRRLGRLARFHESTHEIS